ncbi:hypothetical protein Droror1_Dr00020587, partial [Drosera rotundifolia]
MFPTLHSSASPGSNSKSASQPSTSPKESGHSHPKSLLANHESTAIRSHTSPQDLNHPKHSHQLPYVPSSVSLPPHGPRHQLTPLAQ